MTVFSSDIQQQTLKISRYSDNGKVSFWPLFASMTKCQDTRMSGTILTEKSLYVEAENLTVYSAGTNWISVKISARSNKVWLLFFSINFVQNRDFIKLRFYKKKREVPPKSHKNNIRSFVIAFSSSFLSNENILRTRIF